MQVSNTLNNSIRILFNPKVEAFKLFDFLIVKSNEDRYIAEIIEIYDDKFDASQNVAKLKIFYKINENNEVMPYDNFTPNKECEIIKIKHDEIESFINQDKDTFIFGTNVKNNSALNLQFDFFDNNAVILADKVDNSNAINLNLAKNLSEKKHSVIIDPTGIIELKEAKKIKASKNFKLPLNFATIDFIFDKCLSDASLEFQATGTQIINEVKKYAKKQELGFISFNAFTRVLLEQYKVTPYPELKLLLARIKKHQMSEVFATNKKDYENLFKTIEANPVTIIDLSGIEASWQKAYLEYIVEDMKEDIYLIARINDENCDVDLINKIYCQKKNITFVPNVSYNYKKLPSIVQYCKNYILMPSLYQRTDFLNANFALSNLISEGCIVFGENTDNFLYLAKDYELKVQEEERKNYRKIALSLMDDDEETLEQQLGEKGDYFDNIQKEEAQKTDSEKLMEELSRFEEEKKEDTLQEEKPEVEEKQESKEEQETADYFEEVSDKKENTEILNEETEDEFQELNDTANSEENSESSLDMSIDKESVVLEEMEETEDLEIKSSMDENFEKPPIEVVEPVETVESKEAEEESDSGNIETTNDNAPDSEVIDLEKMAAESENLEYADTDDAEYDNVVDLDAISNEALGDAELDVFEMAENPEDEPIDLNAIADDSMNENFEEIVNSKPKETNQNQTIAIDEKIKIDSEILEKPAVNSSLPIFKEENDEKDETPEFKEGDVVIHPKYGRGVIIKTLKHEQRQLIHVDFEQSDKKLLDPKVANIKLEQ